MRKLLFISCEEAFHICDKAQYGEATFIEKIQLNLRYLWCRFTQAHVRRNKKLTNVINSAHVQSLNQDERQQLLEKFNQQLKNNMQ